MSALLMLLSQRLDPSRNESYNLIKMCKCVDFFLAEGGWTPLHDPSIFFISLGCGLFLFFFWHALWACGIPSLGMHLFHYFFVFIVHILDGYFREKESSHVMEFYFMGGWQCLLSSSVEVCEWMCTWSWSWEYDKSLTRVKEFDQTQSKVKLHMKICAWKI